MGILNKDWTYWTTSGTIDSITGEILKTSSASAVAPSNKTYALKVNEGDVVEFSCFARLISGTAKVGMDFYSDATKGTTMDEVVNSSDWKLYKVRRYVEKDVDRVRMVVGQYTADIGVAEYNSPQVTLIKSSNSCIFEYPTLLNSWVDFDADVPLQFYRDDNDVVHISGVIKSGALPSTVCATPASCKPYTTTHAPVMVRDPAAADVTELIELRISATDVQIITTMSPAPSFVPINVSYVGAGIV